MVGKDSLEESAPNQLGTVTTTAPPPPHADPEALSICSTRTETRREKRRREWHENKIRQSRNRKQHNQAPTSEEQTRLQVPRNAVPEPQHGPGHKKTGLIQGRRRHPPHGRTEAQWKVIEELKLCAGCLTRTTPPHKPDQSHAPCTGQPNVAFDEAKISAIRVALDHLKAEFLRNGDLERTDIRSPQWSGQWRSEDSCSDDNHKAMCRPEDHSSELLAGIAPPTPLISGLSEFMIDEDFESIEEHAQPAVVIPDCESTRDVPRLVVEDWDTKTKVNESPQEVLAMAKDLVEKLECRPANRTWTLQGLYTPPRGFDLDDTDKTLVDEPQEFDTKQPSIVGEVLQAFMRSGAVARSSSF